MKSVYIVSLKHAPGLAKEFALLGGMLARRGCAVCYLLAEGYRSQIGRPAGGEPVFLTVGRSYGDLLAEGTVWRRRLLSQCRTRFERQPPDCVCLYNTHPLNGALLKLAGAMGPGSVRAAVLHEPHKPAHAGYGWRQWMVFSLTGVMQRRALRHATDVILPSSEASRRFEQAATGFPGGVHPCHLLLEEIVVAQPETPRRYFTMAGRFNATKPLDEFVDLINHTAGLGLPYEYQIVTASPIGRWLARLTPQGRTRTRIVNPPVLGDGEIAAALRQSIALFCLHANVTQSGVIPMAYMQGAPVIARDEPGLAQHVEPGRTGWLIRAPLTPAALIPAMDETVTHLSDLSHNARQAYLARFDSRNWAGQYRWLLDALNLPLN